MVGREVSSPPVLLWRDMNTLNQDIILEWAYLFHWAERGHFVRAIKGRDLRLKGVEYNLPVLTRKKLLKRKRYQGRFIYALPGQRGSDYRLIHGLMCTDALVRFHLGKVGEYVSERDFRARRFNPVPEFAVRYNGGDAVVLLFEYSTPDNFRRKKLIEKRLQLYKENLSKFREEFSAEPYVVWVIDAPEWEVEKFAAQHDFNNFYFTDARQFYSVPYGEQLSRQIYIWRGEKVNLYA
jgi:hypothetical protein